MKTIALVLLLTCALPMVHAQPYWVVETNVRQKNFAIVRFYDQHHNLLFEERQIGVFYNPTKRSHKRKLNKMLGNYLQSRSLSSGKSRKQ